MKHNGEMHLRREDSFTTEAPLTGHDVVTGTARKDASHLALGSKHGNGWHLLTYTEDIVHDGDLVVMEFISQGINATNAEVTLDSTKIMKGTILETDFSIVRGATVKLKRAIVAKIYQAEIESLYVEKDKQ